jgi:hypothetical protein
VVTQVDQLATRYDIPPDKLASPTVGAWLRANPLPEREARRSEDIYWLAALRGEVETEGAFLHITEMRWVLRERAAAGLDSPPEVVEALAEGDRRTLHDPRRFLNLDMWSAEVEVDPEATALLDIAAASTPMERASAIAAALGAGVAPEVVRSKVREVVGHV